MCVCVCVKMANTLYLVFAESLPQCLHCGHIKVVGRLIQDEKVGPKGMEGEGVGE